MTSGEGGMVERVARAMRPRVFNVEWMAEAGFDEEQTKTMAYISNANAAFESLTAERMVLSGGANQ